MKQHIQLFYINGEPIDEFLVDRAEFTEGYPVYSRVMFCPQCCSIWAKLTCEGQHSYRPEMVSCRWCTWRSNITSPVPGSLLTYSITSNMVDLELLDVLPEVLLRREFAITLEALENG